MCPQRDRCSSPCLASATVCNRRPLLKAHRPRSSHKLTDVYTRAGGGRHGRGSADAVPQVGLDAGGRLVSCNARSIPGGVGSVEGSEAVQRSLRIVASGSQRCGPDTAATHTPRRSAKRGANFVPLRQVLQPSQLEAEHGDRAWRMGRLRLLRVQVLRREREEIVPPLPPHPLPELVRVGQA